MESLANGYLYLCQRNDHKTQGIHKIGKTERTPEERYKDQDYHAHGGAKLIACGWVGGVSVAERELIAKFRVKFGNPTVGLEYFSGDLRLMKMMFLGFLMEHEMEQTLMSSTTIPTATNSTVDLMVFAPHDTDVAKTGLLSGWFNFSGNGSAVEPTKPLETGKVTGNRAFRGK